MRVSRTDLLKQLGSVQPGLSARGGTEQGDCIAFKDGKVSAFNEEVYAQGPCPLAKEITGAVPAPKLLELLSRLPDDLLEVTASNGDGGKKGGKLLFKGLREREEGGPKASGRKGHASLMADILVPLKPPEEPDAWVKADEDLWAAIDAALRCVGKDEGKGSACVRVHPDFVEACDNFKMCRTTLKTGVKEPALVRGTSLKYLSSLGMAEIGESPNWLHFKSPLGVRMSCRRYLDEQDYPDLGRLFKVKGDSLELPEGVADAVDRRAAVYAAGSTGRYEGRVLIDLSKGMIVIHGIGVEGELRETRSKGVKYAGPPMKFLVQAPVLAEVVRRHGKCELAPGRLKVTEGGKDGRGLYEFVAVLGKPPEE